MNFVVKNIPQGWTLKKMPDVVKWGSGGTPKATEKAFYENGTIPWLIIGDLNDGIVQDSASKITELGLQNSSAKMIPVGTLLVAMYGSIGKLGITGIECCTNQAIAYAKELKGVSTKYMYYYMAMMKSYLISQGKGGTQKNISQTVLNSLDVLVPPEKEQKRIVNRIEELFSELDSAVETLKKTKEQLAVYRQSVLKDAFDSLESPKTVPFGSLLESMRNGYGKKPDDLGSYKILRISSVRPMFLNLDDFRLNNNSFLLNDLIKENDLLFTRYNGSRELVGVCARVPKLDSDYAYPDKIIRCRLKDDCTFLAKFLQYYFCQGDPLKNIRRMIKTTSGQNGIAGSDLKKLDVKLVDVKQQKKIVASIELKLSFCKKNEELIEKNLIFADAMRQSILKKAFEGNL